MEAPSIPWGDLGRVAASVASIALVGSFIAVAAGSGCGASTQSTAEEAAQVAQEAMQQVAKVPQEKALPPVAPEIKSPVKAAKPPAQPTTQPEVAVGEAEKEEKARLERVKRAIATNFDVANKALERVTESLNADKLEKADKLREKTASKQENKKISDNIKPLKAKKTFNLSRRSQNRAIRIGRSPPRQIRNRLN